MLKGYKRHLDILEEIVNEEKALAHQLELELSKMGLQKLFISLPN